MEKLIICGIAGATAAALLGGWDGSMLTLCIFMLCDYITGIVLAAVFQRSTKTASGALESKAGLKGLCRKACMLIIVIIAARLDMLCGLNGVLRTGVIFALATNEAISILENVGAMGVPLPAVLVKAIARLHEETEKEGQNNGTD